MPHGAGALSLLPMEGRSQHNPEWLREQGEQCFRLAHDAWDDQTRNALVDYGKELQHRAERMEAVLRAVKLSP